MKDWTFWRWVVGLLGKQCDSYIDTAPQLRCQRWYGHVNRHRQGQITWLVGTRD